MTKYTPLAMLVLAYMFVLELGAIAAFAYWGSQIHLAVAIGAPLVLIVLWGMFLAPKASKPVLSFRVRTVFKLLVFVLASAALFDANKTGWAVSILVTSVLDVAAVMAMKLDQHSRE